MSNEARKLLKAVCAENQELVDKNLVSKTDMRIRYAQQKKQAAQFLALWKAYTAMSQTYKAKYRAQLERQYLIVKPMATRAELDQIAQAEGAHMLTTQMFSMSNRAVAQTRLAEMTERHTEILAIEKSIQEIQQMFLDMELIVAEQGELIDRVSDHVEQTLEHTQKATEHVEAAVASKRRSQRIKWILSIVAIVIVIIVAVTLAVELGGIGGGSTRSAPRPPSPPPQQPPPQQQSPPQQQPLQPQTAQARRAAQRLIAEENGLDKKPAARKNNTPAPRVR